MCQGQAYVLFALQPAGAYFFTNIVAPNYGPVSWLEEVDISLELHPVVGAFGTAWHQAAMCSLLLPCCINNSVPVKQHGQASSLHQHQTSIKVWRHCLRMEGCWTHCSSWLYALMVQQTSCMQHTVLAAHNSCLD